MQICTDPEQPGEALEPEQLGSFRKLGSLRPYNKDPTI